jgi:hypothetical protein
MLRSGGRRGVQPGSRSRSRSRSRPGSLPRPHAGRLRQYRGRIAGKDSGAAPRTARPRRRNPHVAAAAGEMIDGRHGYEGTLPCPCPHGQGRRARPGRHRHEARPHG